MRHWIKLVTEGAGTSLTVYHGGAEAVQHINVPFFVTPEIKMAASYAHYRAKDDGVITQFILRPKAVALPHNIEEAVESLGLDMDEFHQTPPHEYVSPLINNDAEAVIRELRVRGFDCARFNDYGMDSPFTEYDAFCVFDASILEFEAIIPLKG